jgi:photosynthetic reaction center cytochrome c subunit
MMTINIKRSIGVAALCLFAASWTSAHKTVSYKTVSTNRAACQDRQPAEREKTSAEVYKNIQVFNDLPASQLDGAMQFMSAALGVGCNHCHAGSWDSDAKSSKIAARKMVLMTRNINKESFSGNPAITCYTCHQGQPQTAPVPAVEPRAAQSEPEAVVASPAKLPTTDEVIDRYTRAIGGQEAIDKLKTRVSLGKLITANRMAPPATVSLEIYQQAPNKYLRVAAVERAAFNGETGWKKGDGGLLNLEDRDLNDLKREADFFRFLKLRESYPSMRVLSKEKIGDREAYVVGATSRDNSREKLYFDSATGLLIRKYVAVKTALGAIPEVMDFDDYREAGGVKFPFTVFWSRPPFAATQKFAEMKINLPIDDAKFEKPATK